MAKRLLILAALAGCTDAQRVPESEVHAETICNDRWESYVDGFMPGVTQCETACADELAVQSDAIGDCFVDAESKFLTPGRTTSEQSCTTTFDHEFGGRRGCCIADDPSGVVVFAECKAK